MQRFEITECDYSELDSCLILLKKVFPRYDEAYFNWRYKSELSEKPLIVHAKINDQTISFTSWLKWEFIYNGQKIIIYQAGDSATDPEYRGKGLLRNILHEGEVIAQKRGVDCLLGFPSLMSYSIYYKEQYIPFSINYYHLRLLNPIRKSFKMNYKTEEFSQNSFLFEPTKISPSFNLNYYKWRYRDNPKNYQTIHYEENNNRAIFIIRKGKWKGINEILLLDCQFTSYNDQFIQNSFDFLDRCISISTVFVRTFFNEHSDKGRILLKYFPIRIKSKYNVCIVKPLNKDLDNNIILNCFNWDLMPHCIDEL